MNLIAYKTKSQNMDILPCKAALIENTIDNTNIIYLSNVYAHLKDMLKIVITESIRQENRFYEFELTKCPEFNRFNIPIERISINRLENSMIPQL